MKRLKGYIEDTEALEQLDEGLLRNLARTTSVLANANASRKHGNDAEKHLKNVSSILKKPIPQETNSTEARLERIEKSLEQIAEAMIATKFQIGAVGAISTSSALLSASAKEQLSKFR